MKKGTKARLVYWIEVATPGRLQKMWHRDRDTAERLFAGFAGNWPEETGFRARLGRAMAPASVPDEGVTDWLLAGQRGSVMAEAGAPAVVGEFPAGVSEAVLRSVLAGERDVYAEMAASGFDPLAERDARRTVTVTAPCGCHSWEVAA